MLSRKLDIVSRDEMEKSLCSITALEPEWRNRYEYQLFDTYTHALLQDGRMVFTENGERSIVLISEFFSAGAGPDSRQAMTVGTPFPHTHHDGWRLLPLGTLVISSQGFLCRNRSNKGIARLWFMEFSGVRTGEIVLFRALRGYAAEAKSIETLIRDESGTTGFDNPQLFIAELLDIKWPVFRCTAGSLEDSAVEILQSRLSDSLKWVRQFEPGIISDSDPECLHHYRVGLRQVRSLISIFKPVFSEYGRALKRLLGDLMAKTNQLRDLDVLLDAQADYEKMVDAHHQSGIQGLFDRFSAERLSVWNSVSSWLSGETCDQLIRRAIQLLEPHSPVWNKAEEAVSFAAIMHKRLAKTYKRIFASTHDLSADCPAEQLHAIRILHKRLRYLLDFSFSLEAQEDVSRLLSLLKSSQKHLGFYNDAVVQVQWLQDWANHHSTGLPVQEKAALTALESAFQSQVTQTRAIAQLHVGECISDDTRELVSRISGCCLSGEMAENGV